MNLGFLGPKGTFTDFACQKAVTSLTINDIIEFQSLDQLFDALKDKSVDAIFTPIENSIEGPVNRVLDSLIQSKHGFIHHIYTMQINQSILSFNPDLKLNQISDIISMPHALAQCYSFIVTHCPNAALHHSSSTAGAVPMVDALNLPKETTVVIGHQGIANFFPIHVIEKNIQDQKLNTTQFCLIQNKSISSFNDRSSCLISFSLVA